MIDLAAAIGTSADIFTHLFVAWAVSVEYRLKGHKR